MASMTLSAAQSVTSAMVSRLQETGILYSMYKSSNIASSEYLETVLEWTPPEYRNCSEDVLLNYALYQTSISTLEGCKIINTLYDGTIVSTETIDADTAEAWDTLLKSDTGKGDTEQSYNMTDIQDVVNRASMFIDAVLCKNSEAGSRNNTLPLNRTL